MPIAAAAGSAGKALRGHGLGMFLGAVTPVSELAIVRGEDQFGLNN